MSADLISVFRSKDLTVHNKLADALDAMANEDGDHTSPVIPAVASLLAVSTRSRVYLADITQIEIDFATSTVLGERLVKIPGRYAITEDTRRFELIVLPDLMMPADYATVACKHECAILKQSRYVKQAHAVWSKGSMT